MKSFFFYDFQPALTLPSGSIISVTTFSSKKMLELMLVPVGIEVQVPARGRLLRSRVPGSQTSAQTALGPVLGASTNPAAPQDVAPTWGAAIALPCMGVSPPYFYYFQIYHHPPPGKVPPLSLAVQNKWPKKKGMGFHGNCLPRGGLQSPGRASCVPPAPAKPHRGHGGQGPGPAPCARFVPRPMARPGRMLKNITIIIIIIIIRLFSL